MPDSICDSDFHATANEQVALLRAREFAADMQNSAEEIESLGRCLKVLLLNWRNQRVQRHVPMISRTCWTGSVGPDVRACACAPKGMVGSGVKNPDSRHLQHCYKGEIWISSPIPLPP